MKPIYAIRNNGFSFQEFSLPITEVMSFAPASVDQKQVMKFHYNNLALSTWWPNQLQASFKQIPDKPPASIPDICEWRAACLVLSPKSHELLKTALAPFGELLPVLIENKTYYIFNCLTLGMVDEINSKQDIQNGAFMGIKHIQFNSVDVERKSIFKTTFDRCSTVYCDEKIKSIAEANQLTGIEFRSDLISTL